MIKLRASPVMMMIIIMMMMMLVKYINEGVPLVMRVHLPARVVPAALDDLLLVPLILLGINLLIV